MRSSMYFPMRSLMLAPGLNDSNFAYTGTASGESCTRTSGVSPIVSNTDDRGAPMGRHVAAIVAGSFVCFHGCVGLPCRRLR